METGLYYLNSRYYDAQTGRFLNADDTSILLEDQDSLTEHNLFAYCLNNPVNMADEDGEIAWWIAAAVGVAAFDSAFYLMGAVASGHFSWNDLGKAALKGAVTGVALGSIGKGIKAISVIVKASKPSKAIKITKSPSTTAVVKKIVKPVKVIAGKITGYTKHGLQQAMGRDGGRGVKVTAILNTVRNPIRTVEQANGVIKYVGEQAVVVLNKSGKVITTYAKSSKYWR